MRRFAICVLFYAVSIHAVSVAAAHAQEASHLMECTRDTGIGRMSFVELDKSANDWIKKSDEGSKPECHLLDGETRDWRIVLMRPDGQTTVKPSLTQAQCWDVLYPLQDHVSCDGCGRMLKSSGYKEGYCVKMGLKQGTPF